MFSASIYVSGTGRCIECSNHRDVEIEYWMRYGMHDVSDLYKMINPVTVLTFHFGGVSMTWNEYYSSFYDWANSTQISRISQLTSFGSPDEITEVAVELMDETAAVRLVKKAVAAGVSFSADNCITLMNVLNEDGMNNIVMASKCFFSREQLDDLCCSVSDDILEIAAKRNNVDLVADTDEEVAIDDPPFTEERQPRSGLLGKVVVFFGMLAEDSEKSSDGHCNGDGAHCPPHYGYRYGRWYYGHNHTHGCERGGNKGL